MSTTAASSTFIDPALFFGALAPTTQRLSAPKDGMSLESVTAARGKALREAVTGMATAFDDSDLSAGFEAIFAPRLYSGNTLGLSSGCVKQRAAWNLACIWLLCRHATGENRGLSDAEDWFRGSVSIPVRLLADALPAEARGLVEQHLRSLKVDADFWELMPYLLEEHGVGSRASVIRDPSTKTARYAKRQSGVFYTPSDVADYMARHCLQGAGKIVERRCIDPACGTGVFLLALLRAVDASASGGFDRFGYATQRVYGLDVSGHALDACAFVLLQACWRDAERLELSPWAAWHRLRLNLVQADAVTVQPSCANRIPRTRESFIKLADKLVSTPSAFVQISAAPKPEAGKGFGLFDKVGLSLCDLFPAVENGFELLLGNPPYAVMGDRDDLAILRSSYRSLPASIVGSRTNLFPLFIEMMWRFTRPGCGAAAMVTPLSLAYHSGSQHENCRRAISAAGGRWQFAFFDREPHALFGEEVKTRNAIVFRFEDKETPTRGQFAEIETGPLRKWTSRTRHLLFESIDFTRLGPANINYGIPKLGGVIQATAFGMLRRAVGRLPSWCVRVGTCLPNEAVGEQSVHRVFVGGTAYNFLNVYRYAELADEERSFPLSESPVHCLEFRAEQDAEAVFAILSSRVVFWLWHVLGDGFHVPGWLLSQIPFSRAMFDATSSLVQLAARGRELWLRLREHRFTSLNGGKLTVGYRPLRCHDECDAIDSLLIEVSGLPIEFLDELRAFVRGNAVVDDADERRKHVHALFSKPSV